MTTRAQLRTSARVEADQDNSTFPTDTAYNGIIDRAASAVWRRMLAAGWKPDRTIVNITATGAASYTIGTDVAVVHQVSYTGTSPGVGAFRTFLKRVKPEELQDLLMVPNTGNIATAYDLIGGATSAMTLELYPIPSAGSYEVRYTKRFPGFSSDADSWFGPDGSDELIILTAAIEGVDKENGDTRSLEKRLDKRWGEVIETAGWMDSSGQQTVRDARQHGRYPFNYNAHDDFNRGNDF